MKKVSYLEREWVILQSKKTFKCLLKLIDAMLLLEFLQILLTFC